MELPTAAAMPVRIRLRPAMTPWVDAPSGDHAHKRDKRKPQQETVDLLDQLPRAALRNGRGLGQARTAVASISTRKSGVQRAWTPIRVRGGIGVG